MKLKMIIGTLITTLTASSFAATVAPTQAYTNFLNNVTSDVAKVNDAQSAENDAYAEFNKQLVYRAKTNGSIGMAGFMNAYEAKALPHLVKANQYVLNLKVGASAADINQAINLAKSEINQYQTSRTAVFNDAGVNKGGYFVVNREANLFLCSYQNATIEKTGKKWLRAIIDVKKTADCIVSHEADTSKDLDKKATIYAATVGSVAATANVFLANASYYSGDKFVARVNEFVAAQKADTKQTVAKAIDASINNKTCNAAMDDFRDSFNTASQNNVSLRALVLASQPDSKVRNALNIFGADKKNIIGDSLNITYVSLTGKKLSDSNKDYDVCSYSLYKSNKANNVYLNKLVNFDDIAKRTNGVLSPEQVYQLFVMSSAKATALANTDKNSGSGVLFN
ncbi:MAG: hypothetical protein PHC75_00025 [Burkholderiales bacterium]|nr:hypothetical protein [Burkholderiales bacterium]